jgi:voltage-gated potassium channel
VSSWYTKYKRNYAIFIYPGAFIFYFILLKLLVYYERSHPDHQLDDLFDAIWYTLVTVTTVGYGDIVPITDEGKIISLIFILFGLTLYSLLISTIMSSTNEYRTNKKLGLYGTRMKNHIVIIGWNDYGKAVADQLYRAGRQIAIFTSEKDNVDLINERYPDPPIFVVYGDLDNFEMLRKTNIEESGAVYINLSEDTRKLVYLLNLKKHFGKKRYIVNIDNGDLRATFESAGAVYVISKNDLSSKLLASYIFEPDVAKMSEELITYATTENEYDIKQFEILKNNPYIGSEYNKAYYELKANMNGILIGLVKINQNERTIIKNPEGSCIINEGDFMLMILNNASMKKVQRLFNTKEGIHG